MDNQPRQAASYTAVSGFVMLLYGAYLLNSGFSAAAGASAIYSLAVEVFKWTLLAGGLLLLLAAVICLAGHRNGLLLDAVVSGMSGIILVICAGIWMLKGKGFDIQDAVILIFGVILIREAAASWRSFGATVPAESPPVIPVVPESPHPASIHPDTLPIGEEPPEGYLAALSKEKQEPPSASYE